jgi:long-chain acyl-CoA synthetase
MPLFSGSVISFAESAQTVQKDLAEVSPTFAVLMPRIMEKMRSSIQVKIDDSTLLKRGLYNLFLDWGHTLTAKKMKKEGLSLSWKLAELAAHWGLFRQLRDKFGLLSAKKAVCGGAAVAPELVTYFRAIGVPLAQVYGQTEGLIIFSPAPDEVKPDTVGRRPFAGVEWKLSEESEILWKWEGLFKGYYKDEATTRETIDEEGWLHSGDIGELDVEGHLKIVDRKKNILITSGGKNITPEYIENKIKASPYISDAIVIGEARPYLTALIQIDFDVVSHWAENKRIAFTTLRDLSRNQAVMDLVSQVIDHVNQELSRVEQIKKFRLIDIELQHETGELTATMKVKRKVIDQKFGPDIEAMYGR